MRLAERKHAAGLLDLAELIVEEELCINLRGRLMHCTSCKDVCPSGALTLTPDGVDVDKTLCTGCNGCLPHCPAGALRSTGFVPERFLHALTESRQTHLHCRASKDEGGGVIVPCHGVLDARLLAAARAEGVIELQLHGLNQCESCRYGDARAQIHSVVSQLDEWLGEEAPRLDLNPQAGETGLDEQRHYQDQPHMNRRAFLSLGGVQSVTRAVDWLLPGLAREEEDGEALPFFQADSHPQRASAYQRALVARAERVPWHAGHAMPFRMRRVAEHCSACLSCGQRCPTGALSGSETPQARTLSFDPAACTDCGLCERICPGEAMIVDDLPGVSAVGAGRKTLLLMRQHPCRQCGVPFLPATVETDICPVCSNEQDLDEAWLEMLSG